MQIAGLADVSSDDDAITALAQGIHDGTLSGYVGYCYFLEADADCTADRGWLRLIYDDLEYQFDISPDDDFDEDGMIGIFNKHGLEVDLIAQSTFSYEMRVRLKTDFEQVIWAYSQSKVASSGL